MVATPRTPRRTSTKPKVVEKEVVPSPAPKAPVHNGNGLFWKISTIVLLVLVVATALASYTPVRDWFNKLGQTVKNSLSISPTESKDRVSTHFYIMSQCPFGTQVIDSIAPAIKKLEKYVDFKVDYIGNFKADNNTFESLHGEKEVKGDQMELCAIKNYNTDYKYLDYFVCLNKDAANFDANFEKCAKDNGLDYSVLKNCFDTEAKELLKNSFAQATTAKAQGSPTIYVNDQIYNGGRETLDFTRAICNAYTEKFKTTPTECKDIPACTKDTDCVADQTKIGKCENPDTKEAKCTYITPEKISMTVVTDSRCEQCKQYPQLVDQLKSIFKGLEETETLDYAKDKTAIELVEKYKIDNLPAFIAGGNLKKASNYADFERYVKELDADHILITSPLEPYNPKTADCASRCSDQECKGLLVCRPEQKKQLDLFVMSQCPFGIQAMDGMKEVLSNFKNNLDFSIHYIATANTDGTISSLHGPKEVDEDMRELCAMKHYPQNYQYMDYIWCRNKDIKNDNWQDCADSNNMKSTVIEKCVKEEGTKLLTEDLKLANTLGISASPTWLANNRNKFSALAPEDIKTNYCQYNQVANCDQKLSGTDSNKPAGSCN